MAVDDRHRGGDRNRYDNEFRSRDVTRRGAPHGAHLQASGPAIRSGRRKAGDEQASHGTGPYAGIRPRGYQRTDERIHGDVCDRLMEDPHVDASTIEVQVQGGEVTLMGTIRSRIVKRYVEDLVETVRGVRHVQNKLRVDPRTRVTMGAGQISGGS